MCFFINPQMIGKDVPSNKSVPNGHETDSQPHLLNRRDDKGDSAYVYGVQFGAQRGDACTEGFVNGTYGHINGTEAFSSMSVSEDRETDYQAASPQPRAQPHVDRPGGYGGQPVLPRGDASRGVADGNLNGPTTGSALYVSNGHETTSQPHRLNPRALCGGYEGRCAGSDVTRRGGAYRPVSDVHLDGSTMGSVMSLSNGHGTASRPHRLAHLRQVALRQVAGGL